MYSRRLSLFIILLTILASSLALPAFTSYRPSQPAQSITTDQHSIKIEPWGPTQAEIDAAKSRLLNHPLLQTSPKGPQRLLLSFNYVDRPKSPDALPPDSFLATAYDYTNNRALIARGRFDSADIQVSETQTQPEPSNEEFQAAVAILAKNLKFGPYISNNLLAVYPPMPALVNGDLPAGKVQRTIAVGVKEKNNSGWNEIVGVNMIQKTVIRYPGGAPPMAVASTTACGPADAGQGFTSKGVAGQFQFSISRGGTEIWSFLVIRPSASSGTNGSGVELVNVKYHGKMVLARANAPILNVEYLQNACGPYRDWSYAEDFFAANGTDVAPGIRLCSEPPTTVLESGNDTGNFRGVAVYDSRERVRVVSEMNAGWYRYISEWILSDDGVILPRFGFGAVNNSCVCNAHEHHVYWRFDFDLVNSSNQIFESTSGNEQQLLTEGMRPRLAGQSQQWVIKNLTGDESCVVIPGDSDGNYGKYSRGDLWVLQNHFPNELDDGHCLFGCDTRADINPFINGESVSGVDIVLWYSGHFLHDNADASSTMRDHIVGPKLILRNY